MYKSINMKKIIILLITIAFIGCDQTSQNAGFVLNDDEKLQEITLHQMVNTSLMILNLMLMELLMDIILIL